MTADLLDEYLYEYQIFMANQEVNEKLFQLECCAINEATGILSLQESVMDTLQKWFEKIVNAITVVIQKLEDKLSGLFDKQLEKFGKIMNNEAKPNPEQFEIPVQNYHEYDFTKFRDGTYDSGKCFNSPAFGNLVNGLIGGNGEKPEKLDKKTLLKTVYPNLYDENLSIFDKMRESVIITGKDMDQNTFLTMEMLDNAWEYVSESYKPLIRKIKEDKDIIAAQKKNVDAAAQQVANALQNVQPTPMTANGESAFVFCEQYLTEAPEQEKDIKDQKVGGDEKTGASKETFAKILMTYIQVATDILSAKAKVVNSAFMDKFRIVIYYCKRAK